MRPDAGRCFLAALDQTIVATAAGRPSAGNFRTFPNPVVGVITGVPAGIDRGWAPVFGNAERHLRPARAMIITALSLFVAGSILCALAPNMPVLNPGARRGCRDLAAAASCRSCRP